MHFYASDGAIIAKSDDERGMNVNIRICDSLTVIFIFHTETRIPHKSKRELKILARFWMSAPLRIKCLPNNISVFVFVCCNVAYVGLA